MRPIKLTMQAFGPYAETQTIDMAALGETGIYAITGETGAGKTTIFDAIVYAFYGSGSGEDRSDGRSLRSVAASPELETFVELEFISGGKRYRITRRPAQLLSGRRGGGLVERAASQSLTMPDGITVYTRAKDIEERIEGEILGVTKEQFCQIVMIAQGEFRRLLQAETKDRTVILRRIFKTERFEALAHRFADNAKKKYAALCDSRAEAAFAIRAMRVDDASPLSEALHRLQATEPNALLLDDAEALAREIADETDARRAEARAALEKAEAERDDAKRIYETEKERAAKRERLAALQGALTEQEAALEAAKRQSSALEARKPELERLGAQIAAEAAVLPRYAALEQRVAQANEATKALEKAKDDRRRAEQTKADIERTRDALTREAETLAGASERRLNAMNALNEAGLLCEKLNALTRRVKARLDVEAACRNSVDAFKRAEETEANAAASLKALEDEREALGNTELKRTMLLNERKARMDKAEALQGRATLLSEYGEAKTRFLKALKDYEAAEALASQAQVEAMRLRKRFNDNIAGLLARELADDQPCPVCGSTHHPHKATLVGEAVTEDAVTASEQRARDAADNRNARALTCAEEKNACARLGDQLRAALSDAPEEAWRATLEGLARENAEALSLLEARLKDAEAADARRKRLVEAEIPAAIDQRDAARRAKGDAEAQRKTTEDALKRANAEVEAAAKGVMPDDWTELDLYDAVAQADGRRAQARADAEKAAREIDRLAEIEAETKRCAERLERAAEYFSGLEAHTAALSEKRAAQGREIEVLRRELPYETAADCESAIAQKTARRKALEDAIETARTAVDERSAAVAGTRGQLAALAEEVANAPIAALDDLLAAYNERASAQRAAAKREKDLHSLAQGNLDRQSDLRRAASEARALEREYIMMKDVSDTVNGNVSGSKITLEAYVQTAYFDRIIAYANRRLIHMSRQQYDLARQNAVDSDGRGKKGLELDVVDHANGRRRAVGTLSGGEGFLASLSFALGMSDAIQASAATAVQLDAMFVDEGFGSLSESFLNLVMDELNDTATEGHRLIGVISHVDEVKEGIDRRIEVSKGPNGVSRAKVV